MVLSRLNALLLATILLVPVVACDNQETDTPGASAPTASSAIGSTGSTPSSESAAPIVATQALNLDADQMRQAVDEALSIPDRLDRVARLTTLWLSLTPDNFEAAREAFEKDINRSQPLEIRLFTNAWARLDPVSALEGIRDWRFAGPIAEAQEEILLTWVLRGGADEAVAWTRENVIEPGAESAGPNHTPNAILKTLLEAVALQGGSNEELTALIEPYPESQSSNFAIANTVLQLRRIGKDRMYSWVESIPADADNNLSYRVWQSAISIAAKGNVENAKVWYAAHEDYLADQDVLPRLARTYFQTDPAGAFGYLLERKPSDERTATLQSMFKFWFTNDAPGAAAWVEANLDRAEVRETGLAHLTVYTLRSDVGKAISLAAQLPDNQRTPAMKQCLVAWGRRDIVGLKKYLDANDVSVDIRNTVNLEHGRKLKALEDQQGQEQKG
jgi:hypothetical protein